MKQICVLSRVLACVVFMITVGLARAQETETDALPDAPVMKSAEQHDVDAAQTDSGEAAPNATEETPAPAAQPQPAGSAEENGVFELLSPSQSELSSDAQKPEASAPGVISVSFDEVPVSDVVNMFSRISGANIIVAGSFTNHFVTANLKNVQWKAALNLVLGSVELSMIEDQSGIIMVVTSEMYQQKLKQLEDTKPLATRVFTPHYLNPVDLVEQIRQMNVLSPRGSIITSQSKEQHQASLKSSETTARPFATTEPRQNPSITTVVVVTDIKEYMERALTLMQQLDKREPQVFIETRIIDITSSDGSKIGFDWEMLDSFGVSAGLQDMKWSWSDTSEVGNSKDNKDLQFDRRSYDDVINKRYDMDGRQYEEEATTYEESPPDSGNWVARTVVTPTRSIDDSISSGREITSEYGDTVRNAITRTKTASALLQVSEVSLILSALKKTGNAKMLSHPLIIVGNRVEAKIHVGEMTWQITLRKDVVQSGAAPQTDYSEEATEVQLGLKLWVIPEIDLEADVVRLTVNPEMTVFVENITTAQGSIYPVTSTRTITTRVNVPSGETLMIGGLIEYTTAKKEKRVPFLGDIPILGLLFRHTEELTEKHNLVVMLTPTILDDAAPSTGYEAMGWQAIEGFEMVPLGPSKSQPIPAPAPEEKEKEEPAVEDATPSSENAVEDATPSSENADEGDDETGSDSQ